MSTIFKAFRLKFWWREYFFRILRCHLKTSVNIVQNLIYFPGDDLQELQKEVDDLSEKIADLNDQKYRLAITNPTADTSTIDAAIADLNERLLKANQGLSERQTGLEQALLQFGKFNDAMESLLQWIEETKDLLESQGSVSAAEPKVVKAQMNEQKVRHSKLSRMTMARSR